MNIYWKNTVPSGSFTSAGNWVQSSVPGGADIAELTTSGGIFVTVSSGSPVTVLGVNIGAGALLQIETDFTATEGTLIGANRGTVDVVNGAQFAMGGRLNNSGNVNVNSGSLAVQSFDLTVNGGGTIGLLGSAADMTIASGLSLSNVDNQIVGGGTISGPGTLINQKNGIISAMSGSLLTIDAPTKNTGLIEAGSGSQLNISARIDNSSGGIIRSDDFSDVFFGAGADIIGGILDAGSFGDFFGSAGCTLDGGNSVVPTNTMITTSGSVEETGGGALNVRGTINNKGSININGPLATLVVQAAGTNNTVTLKGSGSVDLAGSQIAGGGIPVTLDNVNNTIAAIGGNGKIGGDGLRLKNEVGGTIEAAGKNLTIDTGANAITNAGVMEAIGATLVIGSNLNNTGTLKANNGTIYAAGTVTGGTAIISGLGFVNSVEFGAASTAATQFATGTTGQLILADSAQYTGVISGFGANPSIDLADFDFTGAHKVSFSLGVLTLKNTTGQVVHLHFSGTHTLASFQLSDDNNFNGTDDGTKITDPPVPTNPQAPPSNPLASLFGQFIASWNPIAALSSEVHSPLTSELQIATNLLHAHG